MGGSREAEGLGELEGRQTTLDETLNGLEDAGLYELDNAMSVVQDRLSNIRDEMVLDNTYQPKYEEVRQIHDVLKNATNVLNESYLPTPEYGQGEDPGLYNNALMDQEDKPFDAYMAIFAPQRGENLSVNDIDKALDLLSDFKVPDVDDYL